MNADVQKLLEERYYLSNENEWSHIAERVSDIYKPAHPLILEMEFIPSTPTLQNANTKGERLGTLSSCFILGISDSIEGIFESLKECAVVTKMGGGVGYVFSNLRSSYEGISTLGNRPSSGPIPFMHIFNATLDGVSQGGVRRGAGMAQSDIDHPDILNLVVLKEKEGILERFNVSLRINNAFYEKLKNDPDSPHLVKTKKGEEFPLYHNGEVLTTKMLWDIIILKAWESAEPGIFNVDIATKQCSVTNLSSVVASNPCAEYTNIEYSSCNLGSINLLKYVMENGSFNWDKFNKDVRIATRFLDSVIDVNEYPLEKIEVVTKAIRPIGLGIMALGNALYKMGIPYHSEQAHDFIERLTFTLTMTSMDESIEMAKKEGAYPAFDIDTFINANERLISKLGANKSILIDRLVQYGVRNSCFTSIAPNGSISFIAGKLSGGIEPVFALVYMRRIEKENKQYETVYITDPVFEEYLNNNYSESVKREILNYVGNNNGSCQGCSHMLLEDQEIFVTANDLTPMEHLEVLGIVARNTSLSVSKTINMPNTATPEDISEVYIKAHELGICGVTVYRDGCRKGILTTSEEESKFGKHDAPKRPKKLDADYTIVKVHGIEYAIITGLLNNKPYEVFAIVNPLVKRNLKGQVVKISKGVYKFVSEDYEIENIANTTPNEKVITVLASMLLRHGADIKYVIHQCKKMSNGLNDFMSAISRVLKRYIPDGESAIDMCPNCDSSLVHENGCVSCHSCGWSGCN